MTLPAKREVVVRAPGTGRPAGPGFRFPVEGIPVIAIVLGASLMVMPVPPFLLDVFLTVNLSLSLTILVTTIYVRDPLEFSVFPSVLLMATLLRLSLNICSTRLILLQGYAGNLIEAFGQFVMGGNYVVGFVTFVILSVIQFVVITHGAQRVAEVTARFTLDALPGKQMAIDADIAAGLLNEDQARLRRKMVQREADFFGSMDGASKFIRGDAIAAVIILVVNIIGGFLIGVVQLGLEPTESMARYTLLTVGEGLAAQLPAILVSIATGLMVTRAASDEHMGQDLASQMTLHPAALAWIAGFIGFFGLMPGMPKIPFLLLSAGFAGAAFRLKKKLEQPPPASEEGGLAPQAPKGPEDVTPLLDVEPMELEIGYSLTTLVDSRRTDDLLGRVVGVRRTCALDLGIVVPPIRIHDSFELRPTSYAIKIYGAAVATGEVMVGRYLALNTSSAEEDIDGVETREPAFGMPAMWITEQQKDEAEALGCTVVDPSSVIATHLSEIIVARAAELLGRDEVQVLLDRLKQQKPALIDDLIPGRLSLGEVHRVLQNLLRERISIRNFRIILETLADWAGTQRDPMFLTEQVRVALGRNICARYRQPDGVLYCVTLDESVEAILRDAAAGAETPRPLAPLQLKSLYASLGQALQKLTSQGCPGVVLCAPQTRAVFRYLVERAAPTLAVLSYREVPADQPVTSLAVVSVGTEGT